MCRSSPAAGFELPFVAREASRSATHAGVTGVTRASRARCPQAARALFGGLLLRRPELRARGGLLGGDRGRRFDQQVNRLAQGDVLAQRFVGALLAGSLQGALELLLARVGAGRLAQRLSDLLVGDL